MSELPLDRRLLSDISTFTKYARYLDMELRRETWDELVDRNKQMHKDFYRPRLDDDTYFWLEVNLERVYEDYVRPKKLLMSMRSAQFAGAAILRDNNRIYNCSYAPVDSIATFSETMFLLLGGTGTGYSVQRRHVDRLPAYVETRGEHTYVVPDSIEGWSDAIKAIMSAHFPEDGEPKARPVFDLSQIRPKGARLVTSGGKAPGPEPLRQCLDKIQSLLDSMWGGYKMTPFDVHYIQCLIADAVLAGGIRRAAMICLFDHDDEEMLRCKQGAWWETRPELSRANNSAVLIRGVHGREEFDRVWAIASDQSERTGEPGVFWTNDPDYGTNPCAEIGLAPFSFCNLVDINTTDLEGQEDLDARAEAAAFLATVQAGYTDFRYLRPIWRETTERDALVGVGATGIAAGRFSQLDLERAANQAVVANQFAAGMLGLAPAARVTTVKPSGTSSLVLGSSSGIHAWHAPYYIRRMRFNKNESIYQYLKAKLPELIEDDLEKPDIGAILSVPVKAPEGAITRHDETAIDLLERVADVYERWIEPGHVRGPNTNNVSATINVRDDEWDAVGEWMWENREKYAALSVLPAFDAKYQQMPFEDITEAEYERLMGYLKEIDLSEIMETEDGTDLFSEIACGGGACDILAA